ncbi:MAG: hypothetical protein V1727_04205 [Candidatus Omnitrophota bacterium]
MFFLGWLLSPFTWWNDALVNLPLSYLMASVIFHYTHLPFRWLVLGSYWLTNIVGLLLMYFGGKHLILESKKRIHSILWMILFLAVYSALMIYLDCRGKLIPLGELLTH